MLPRQRYKEIKNNFTFISIQMKNHAIRKSNITLQIFSFVHIFRPLQFTRNYLLHFETRSKH